MYLRTLLALGITVLSLEAEAETVTLSGRRIELPIPSGYCQLAASRPDEAELMRATAIAIGDGNQILAAFADCMELEQFRGGKRKTFNNYGQILAQSPKGKLVPIRGVSREEFIRRLGGMPMPSTTQTTDMTEKAIARFNQSLSQGSISLEAQRPYWLQSDQNATYFGVFAQMVDVYGKKSNLLGVIGMTLVKDMSLSINMYRKFSGSPPLELLIPRQRAAMGALVSANR